MFKAFDEMNFIFFVVGAAGFVAGANMRVLDPLLPLIGLDLGVEATMLAIVLTAYSLSYGIFQFVYGPLSEKYGKIKVMFWASVANVLEIFCKCFGHGLGMVWICFGNVLNIC